MKSERSRAGRSLAAHESRQQLLHRRFMEHSFSPQQVLSNADRQESSLRMNFLLSSSSPMALYPGSAGKGRMSFSLTQYT